MTDSASNPHETKAEDSSASSVIGPGIDSSASRGVASASPEMGIVFEAGMISSGWSGPLPPPNDLAKFGQVDPTFPERIMRLAESEAEHRRQLEAQTIKSDIETRQRMQDERTRGQKYGLTIAMTFLGVGAWLAYLGHTVVATTLLGTTLVSLTAVFVVGRIAWARHQAVETKEPGQRS